MSLIYCANCEGKCSSDIENCPHCGHPIKAQKEVSSNEEKHLFTKQPAMWRDQPITFILLILLAIPTFGITALVLLWWWLKCITTQLIVTTKIATLKTGIIAKHTSEIRHSDIKNTIVNQSIQQRIFGVGSIALSSAGQSDLEIIISGIKKPQEVVKQLRALQ
tara:strand:- start:53 stop:541 length:489 start_codon:yes stop_codon:yes gene_type:complete